MADNNATDITEDGQRKQAYSENGIRSPSLMGPNKNQEKVGTGNLTKGVSEKRKRWRSTIKHRKAKKSYKNKHSKSKPRYRNSSSSSSKEKSAQVAQASQALIVFILFIVGIFFLGVFRDKK